MLSRSILLDHDNARPPCAYDLTDDGRDGETKAEDAGTSTLQALAPSISHLFGPLKILLAGYHFSDDGKVEQELCLWL